MEKKAPEVPTILTFSREELETPAVVTGEPSNPFGG